MMAHPQCHVACPWLDLEVLNSGYPIQAGSCLRDVKVKDTPGLTLEGWVRAHTN